MVVCIRSLLCFDWRRRLHVRACRLLHSRMRLQWSSHYGTSLSMSTIKFDHPLAPLPERKRIALVAHDGKKAEMCVWARQHREELSRHTLYGTGTTGALLEREVSLPVIKCASGPLGGDQQIGAMIVEERIDMLFFFWDPLTAQPHDPDVKALLRIAALYEIPIACNRASADFLVTSELIAKVYPRREGLR
jgi:methylglyoxal synthase